MTLNSTTITTLSGESIHIATDDKSLFITIDALFLKLSLDKVCLEDHQQAISLDDGSFRFMLGDDYMKVYELIRSVK